MCGISGINWKNKNLITKMNNSLKHIGLDDGGTFFDNSISPRNQRLSIVDLKKRETTHRV